jgi:hypothetical protein
MDFVQSFENYLRNSIKRPFVIGDWLTWLPTEQLNELIEMTEQMEEKDPRATVALGELLIRISISETLSREVDFELLPAIGIAAALQKYARLGLIILHKPIVLTGELSFTVTSEAMEIHDAVLEKICKMTMH